MPDTQLQSKYKILSGSMLKLLAVITMTIDHTALILAPVLHILNVPISILGNTVTLYWIMRKIGRLAFPLFCFLIAEGYRHTRSKLRYGLRLLIFAVISEIPYDIVIKGSLFYFGAQNVYFTLFLGLMMIYVFDTIKVEWKKFLALAAIGTLAYVLKGSYDLPGALLVLLFYLLRNHPAARAIFAYPLLSGGVFAWAAMLPISLYNGQRGFIKSPALKFMFYIFYPVHLLILIGICYLIK